MGLYEQVDHFIQQEIPLTKDDLIVVGVSGGVDSISLLDVLVRLQFRVIPAYFDHKLHDRSETDGQVLNQFLLSQYDFSLIRGEGEVTALAAEGYSIEEAARILRYRFLLRVAIDHHAAWLSTGHTLDDQAETLLLHLIRGAGLRGMRGIQPCTNLSEWSFLERAEGIRLCRPLLQITGEETRRYVRERKLELIEDPTNQDQEFLRNRVRAELVPLLKSYNPRFLQAIHRTARISSEAYDYIQAAVEETRPTVVEKIDNNHFRIHRRKLLDLEPALRAAMILQIIEEIASGSPDPSYELVQAVLEYCEEGRQSKQSLAGGLEILALGEAIEIFQNVEIDPAASFPQLRNDGVTAIRQRSIPLAATWSLQFSNEKLTAADLAFIIDGADPWMGVFNQANLSIEGLILRTPEPGDRIQPLGMNGRIKLSDLFINEGIPREARKRWPILAYDDEIVWVVGLRQSESFKLGLEGGSALIGRASALQQEEISIADED